MNAISPPYPEYPEQLAYIRDTHAREAFVYLVEQAFSLADYTAKPHPHGFISRNLHYFDKTGDCSFAFSVAQKWLLFYLRNPDETHPGLSVAGLERTFGKPKLTRQGEINFQIRTVEEAREAMALVFGLPATGGPNCLPEEVQNSSALLEGSITSVVVNSFERNAVAREACIKHYGYRCAVCSFKFDDMYGSLGRDFIHVHHLVELSTIRTEYNVDPIRDLRPVCANCHAMLHRRSPALSIEELQRNLTRPST